MTFSALLLVARMRLPTGVGLAGVLVWMVLTPFAPRINQRLRNLTTAARGYTKIIEHYTLMRNLS